MASFVSLSGSIVMKSGVKSGRVGISSERKFPLVSIHTVREMTKKTSNCSQVQQLQQVQENKGTSDTLLHDGEGDGMALRRNRSVYCLWWNQITYQIPAPGYPVSKSNLILQIIPPTMLKTQGKLFIRTKQPEIIHSKKDVACLLISSNKCP